MKEKPKVVSKDFEGSLESKFQTKLVIQDFPKTQESIAKDNPELGSKNDDYGQYVEIEDMEYDVYFGSENRVSAPASNSASDSAPNSKVASQNVDRLSRSSSAASETQFEMD